MAAVFVDSKTFLLSLFSNMVVVWDACWTSIFVHRLLKVGRHVCMMMALGKREDTERRKGLLVAFLVA